MREVLSPFCKIPLLIDTHSAAFKVVSYELNKLILVHMSSKFNL